MDVQELFKKLSYGELSNLSIGGSGNGSIPEDKQPKIIMHANQALERLYSRFILKEEDVSIELYPHITFYHLVPRFARNYVSSDPTKNNEPIRYILDLPEEKFEGDVVKILRVADSRGRELPLNDEVALMSLFTPQGDMLQVPNPMIDTMLSVVYQAKHIKLDGSLDQHIELPTTLEEAMTAYIGYKVFSQTGTEGSTAKAQEHLGIYEKVCGEITQHDLVNSSKSTTNVRFEAGGWA